MNATTTKGFNDAIKFATSGGTVSQARRAQRYINRADVQALVAEGVPLADALESVRDGALGEA